MCGDRSIRCIYINLLEETSSLCSSKLSHGDRFKVWRPPIDREGFFEPDAAIGCYRIREDMTSGLEKIVSGEIEIFIETFVPMLCSRNRSEARPPSALDAAVRQTCHPLPDLVRMGEQAHNGMATCLLNSDNVIGRTSEPTFAMNAAEP